MNYISVPPINDLVCCGMRKNCQQIFSAKNLGYTHFLYIKQMPHDFRFACKVTVITKNLLLCKVNLGIVLPIFPLKFRLPTEHNNTYILIIMEGENYSKVTKGCLKINAKFKLNRRRRFYLLIKTIIIVNNKMKTIIIVLLNHNVHRILLFRE